MGLVKGRAQPPGDSCWLLLVETSGFIINPASALDAFGFPLGRGFDPCRSVRIFVPELGERGAGLFLGAEGMQTLAKPQQSFRRARRAGVIG
jgi:hypothetical protein